MEAFFLSLPEVSEVNLCLCHASSMKMLLAFQEVPQKVLFLALARRKCMQHTNRYGSG